MTKIILAPMVFALAVPSLLGQMPICNRCARAACSPPTTTETFALSDGEQVPLQWDVYLPDAQVWPTPWPVVVLIHGGGFAGGTRDDSQIKCAGHDLADAGFAAVSIDYRLDRNHITGQTHDAFYPPSAPWDQISDVQKAIRAARHPAAGSALYGNVNCKVGAIGGSAGGSHALWWAAAGTPGDDKLDAAVLLSGIYVMDDLASLTDPHYPNYCPNLKTYCTVPPEASCNSLSGNNKLQTGSPAYQITLSVAPLFLIDCVNDGGTPANQKILLNDRLNLLQVTHDCAQVGPEKRANNCNHAFQYWCDSTVTCDTGTFKGYVNELSLEFLGPYLKGICP
jgi:pimeloyl-ACP methyl ester carboxylesterase